jgi:hypothetical protein
MKQIIAAIFLTPLMVFGQGLSKEQEEPIVRYDRFKDTTTVASEEITLWKHPPLIWFTSMRLGSASEGPKMVKPKIVVVMVAVRMPGVRAASSLGVPGVDSLTNDTLDFIADGSRVHATAPLMTSVRDWQYTTGISFEDLIRLAQAKTVEGKVGPIEFKLDAEAQRRIRRFLDVFGRENGGRYE